MPTSNRLLTALHEAPLTKDFVCPYSGLTLTMHCLSRGAVRAARAAAAERWGDKAIQDNVALLERMRFDSEELLARAVLCDGQPIGMATVDQLPEHVLTHYEAIYDAVSAKADPPAEEWNSEEVEDFLKKKAERAAVLSGSAGKRVIDLALILADRLAPSAT